MSTASPLPRRQPLARAADEFALTTVLLFLAVTVVRWLRDPASTLYIADLHVALAVIGVLSGIILTGLMFSPPGKRAGGHMNPAVTIALWLMNGFPGRSVPPYVLAQLAGSAVGTVLGRLVWGHAVSFAPVDYAAIRAASDWQPASVFLAEMGSMMVLILSSGSSLPVPAVHACCRTSSECRSGWSSPSSVPAAGDRSTPPASSVLLHSLGVPPIYGSIWSRRSWERHSGPRSTT